MLVLIKQLPSANQSVITDLLFSNYEGSEKGNWFGWWPFFKFGSPFQNLLHSYWLLPAIRRSIVINHSLLISWNLTSAFFACSVGTHFFLRLRYIAYGLKLKQHAFFFFEIPSRHERVPAASRERTGTFAIKWMEVRRPREGYFIITFTKCPILSCFKSTQSFSRQHYSRPRWLLLGEENLIN